MKKTKSNFPIDKQKLQQNYLVELGEETTFRNEGKTIKNSIPSYLLESEGENMCRAKLDEVLKQNEELKMKLYEVRYQNQALVDKNRELETDIQQLISEISHYQASQSPTPLKTKNKNFQRPQQERKSSQPSFSSHQNHEMKVLRKMVDNLNQENQLLIKMKQTSFKKNGELLKKMKQLEQKLEDVDSRYIRQREDNIRKTQKLKEEYLFSKENEKNLQKLERVLRETSEELQFLRYEGKKKSQEVEAAHQKFHRDLEKMREKVEKYKKKAENYRSQRDQLSIEIQKAKLQLGAVTLRKYFPDDSDP